MKDLNSVLLEGAIKAKPKLSGDSEHVAGSFDLESRRDDKATTVRVLTRGKLAQVCADYLETGRKVRTVGRLAADANGVLIEAEHVEFCTRR